MQFSTGNMEETIYEYKHLRYIWQILKEHGNDADILGFLHKSVTLGSLTLPFEPFRFWFKFVEIFAIENFDKLPNWSFKGLA
jgi:hypothetical protein